MKHEELRSILLIEDNPADARLIQKALEERSVGQWNVVCVERLSEALAQLRANTFGVALLDLSLPDSEGFETINRVQSQAPQVPIIVLTGNEDEEFAIRAVQAGAQDYLMKGQIVPSALIRTIKYAIERHRLSQALHTSETRYRNLFENASDAIVSFTLEGQIISVNRGLEILLGWTREELIGQHYQKLLTPSSAAQLEERIATIITTNRQRSNQTPFIELDAVRRDGTIIPVEVSDDILYDDWWRLAGVMIMARNMTFRKELERRRTEFLAMLSHDIKNPLSVLIGYADYLQHEVQEHGAVKSVEVLPWIKSSALTILSLVNNYLDLSRIEDQQLILAHEPLGINDLLNRIGHQYKGEALHRKIHFEMSLDPKLPWVASDPAALDRVLTNLIYNALKFTPNGGQVTVRSLQRGDEVVIGITDSGPGIVQEEIPLLFEKYRRAVGTRRKEGMGLGLFIVKTLIERLGGRIEVASVVGRGTEFSVILPIGDREISKPMNTTKKEKEAISSIQ
jgi:PAS domain S-box-containing protein